MKKLTWLSLIALACACSDRFSRQEPIPLDKMKLVMWDMIKAGEWYNVISAKDTTARRRKEDVRLYSQVLTVYGLTREQFYDSYKYYEAHPREFKLLVDSIDAYSNRQKNLENERLMKAQHGAK